MFKKAQKSKKYLKVAIDGPAGSGKTYTSLRFAHTICPPPKKIALIDTEGGSSQMYAGKEVDGIKWDFDVVVLTNYHPDRYVEAIESAVSSGYGIIIIDSLSHAWAGTGGVLDLKEKSGESWTAWRHVTPFHNKLVDMLLQSPIHLISTMRSKTEYVMDEDLKGKPVLRRLGMAPVQRSGTEYEFDLVVDMNWDHDLTVAKTRYDSVDGVEINRPGASFINKVLAELMDNYVEPPKEYKIEDLLSKGVTVEQIISANDGSIPKTSDEVLAVSADLGVLLE